MNASDPFVKSLDRSTLERHPALSELLLGLGETPLLQVPGPKNGARILAKCEWTNPNGTVKDRAVFGMVYDQLRRRPRHLHLLEHTGGSLGLSLSRLCKAVGIGLTLTLSESTPDEIVSEIREHGAQVVLTPRAEGFWGVVKEARALAAENPGWTYLDQHTNNANLWIHRETTGPEIARQLPKATAGCPCAWVASIGTGATLAGVYTCLREKIPELRVHPTTPAEMPYGTLSPPNGLPKFLGSGGLGEGRRQSFVTPIESQLTRHHYCRYDQCLAAMGEFALRTGLKIGSSAAANWLAACAVAEELGPRGIVVTLFPSLATNSEWTKVESARRLAGSTPQPLPGER